MEDLLKRVIERIKYNVQCTVFAGLGIGSLGFVGLGSV